VDFEWDSAKDKANRRKHGVAFDEAASVFFERVDSIRIISARTATRAERKLYEEG
jgi:uncharacterized DUF497 family protein